MITILFPLIQWVMFMVSGLLKGYSDTNDKKAKDRVSSKNLTVQEIYKEFFIPTPELAEELLHYHN